MLVLLDLNLRFKDSNSISTKIGVKPTCIVGLNVAGNPAIGVITLVPLGKFKPLLDVRAAIISKLALEPLLTITPVFDLAF
jgi:hypothetical protein